MSSDIIVFHLHFGVNSVSKQHKTSFWVLPYAIIPTDVWVKMTFQFWGWSDKANYYWSCRLKSTWSGTDSLAIQRCIMMYAMENKLSTFSFKTDIEIFFFSRRKYAFSLVKSKLALGSPIWLGVRSSDCHHAEIATWTRKGLLTPPKQSKPQLKLRNLNHDIEG